MQEAVNYLLQQIDLNFFHPEVVVEELKAKRDTPCPLWVAELTKTGNYSGPRI